MRTGNLLLLAALATGLSGCHVLTARSCPTDNGVYTKATSIPPLQIPAGVDPPDTKSALKVPDLNEPAPPPRGPKDACLDEPPKYSEPRGPKPPPAV